MAYDLNLIAAIHNIFSQAVFASLRRRAGFSSLGRRAKGDAVTFVQRFGDGLNLNVHFHTRALDGMYAEDDAGFLRFHNVGSPSDKEVLRVAGHISRRVEKLILRQGLLFGASDTEQNDQPFLMELYGAAVGGRVLSGPRAGQKAVRMGNFESDHGQETPSPRCVNVNGVGLHANTVIPAHDRVRLERMCRYMCRPPIAIERLKLLSDGRLLYQLKKKWRGGTSHIIFQPLELMERLAALVPAPRFNLIRYSGVLAPSAAWRRRIIPKDMEAPDILLASKCGQNTHVPGEAGSFATAAHEGKSEKLNGSNPRPHDIGTRGFSPECSEKCGQNARVLVEAGSLALAAQDGKTENEKGLQVRPRRYMWAELLKRVFSVDALKCNKCGNTMRILCAVNPPDAIRKILDCLGLPSRPPPVAPASIRYEMG